MQLRQLGSNKTEVEFTDGTTVFFSYETPVALQTPEGHNFKTEDFWSVTTSKHINQWLKNTVVPSVNSTSVLLLPSCRSCMV